MDKYQKFGNFLESLKNKNQDSALIESIKQGFKICMENEYGNENEYGTSNIDEIVSSYIEAMLWTEVDEIKDKGIEDLSPESLNSIKTDVTTFYEKNKELIDMLPAEYGHEQIGHDFWLTRNGHGAGFWDRGLGELGDKLTDATKEFGESNLYIGDDGKLYIQ